MNRDDTTTVSSHNSPGLHHESSIKVRGRPWPKGVSGNPSGRRRGTVSLTATLKRVLTREQAETVARRLIDLATGGDVQAAKLLFERIDGKVDGISVFTSVAVATPSPPERRDKTAEFDWEGYSKLCEEFIRGAHTTGSEERQPPG